MGRGSGDLSLSSENNPEYKPGTGVHKGPTTKSRGLDPISSIFLFGLWNSDTVRNLEFQGVTKRKNYIIFSKSNVIVGRLI